MQLTLEIHPITAIRFGGSSRLDETSLIIDAEQLRALLLEDRTFTAVDLEIASPGESCRSGF
jgi:glycine reductase